MFKRLIKLPEKIISFYSAPEALEKRTYLKSIFQHHPLFISISSIPNFTIGLRSIQHR